jgi:hypothetical protein
MIKKPIAALINIESDKNEIYPGILPSKRDRIYLDRNNHKIDKVKTMASIYPYLFFSGI